MRRTGLLIVAMMMAVACGGDDGGSEPPVASDDGSSASTLAGEELQLSSPAFGEGEMIPAEFAGCVDGAQGPNESPPLEWRGVPDAAVALAVTVVDPDADDFVHWVIAGLEPTSTGLAQNAVPEGAVEALNDTGSGGWFGPCPPEPHTYVFRLHALREDPGVAANMPGDEAVAAITTATELMAELSAEFDPDA